MEINTEEIMYKSLKLIFVSILFVVLTACGTRSINLAENLPPSTRIELTSKCDYQCQTVVMDKYGFEPNHNIWGNNMFIKEALIVSLNGEYGLNRHYDPRGSYNSTANSSFQIFLVPGETSGLVRAAPVWTAPKSEMAINFSAKPGHKYFIGNLRFRESLFSWSTLPIQYRWLPLVVDITEKTALLPDADLNWLFYYSLAGEPDSYEPTLEELNEFEYKDHERIKSASK